MKLNKIEEIAHAVLLNNKGAQPLREPGYIYYHGQRVAELCKWLCSQVGAKGINKNNLYAASLFHDIAKGKAHHALAGSKIIGDVLGDSVNNSERENIERLVREHNLRELPNKCSRDSKILQDADILDHFGAQGVWLSTCITVKSGKIQQDMIDYVFGQNEKAYIKERYSQLNFTASKNEFKRRMRFQKNFFKRLREEMMLTP